MDVFHVAAKGAEVGPAKLAGALGQVVRRPGLPLGVVLGVGVFLEAASSAAGGPRWMRVTALAAGAALATAALAGCMLRRQRHTRVPGAWNPTKSTLLRGSGRHAAR